jgi:hypothetical protein
MERQRNRLLEEAAAKQAAAAAIERDIAEFDRLAELARKYNFVVSPGPHKNEDHVADGTISSLAHLYRTDERSPFHQIRFRTRETYANLLKRVESDCGDVKLADLKAQDIERLYTRWKETGKVAMPHSLVTMLRMLFGFGAVTLADAHCERLSVLMSKMRFSMAKPRTERLTVEQIVAIRLKAHEMKRPSIALAQAFQFDCTLGQKDVIGEWVPQDEPGPLSEILHGGRKWLRGLRWSQIDENLVLRHTTSFGSKSVEFDLRRAPMVMEELKHLNKLPTSGPIIVCERTGRPWSDEFRREWRKIATACGIPKHIKNMDSRPRLSVGAVQGENSEEVGATGEYPRSP